MFVFAQYVWLCYDQCMQVSIYLTDDITKKVDQSRKTQGWSRSKFIASILQQVFSVKKSESVFDDIFGILSHKSANELLRSIQNSRKNSTRFL